MKLIILFFIAISCYGLSYPNFSDDELRKIENKISKNRINDYIQNVKNFKNLPKEKQLIKVNSYLNQLLPQYDSQEDTTVDYWKTPKEFLISGFGDCEDYAIIKYYTLVKLGFDENRLYLTVVKDKFSQNLHMVLSYFNPLDNSVLILDNLSFRVLNIERRDDFVYKKFINKNGVFILNKKNELIKKSKKHPKMQDLLKRIKKGN
jgi:predicted transglutaminase-like cysteine proteinase